MSKETPKFEYMKAGTWKPISRDLPRLRLEVKKSHDSLYETLFRGEVDPYDLYVIESYMRGLEDAVRVAIERKASNVLDSKPVLSSGEGD